MAANTLDFPLTSTYQQIGTGPGFISMKTGFLAEIRFTSGTPVGNEPSHTFTRNGIIAYDYQGTLDIFAKKSDTDTKDVILAYTEL